MGDLPTSQGIDEQGDQPTIRSSAPERAAVESLPEPLPSRDVHDVGAEERIGRSNRRNRSSAASGERGRWQRAGEGAEDREARGGIVIDKARSRRGRLKGDRAAGHITASTSL